MSIEVSIVYKGQNNKVVLNCPTLEQVEKLQAVFETEGTEAEKQKRLFEGGKKLLLELIVRAPFQKTVKGINSLEFSEYKKLYYSLGDLLEENGSEADERNSNSVC